MRLGEAALRWEGSTQAGQDELSKERLLPAGKGSFTTCGIALTTFAAHRVLSAQEAKLPELRVVLEAGMVPLDTGGK